MTTAAQIEKPVTGASRHLWILATILGLALAIRLWGIQYGLPHVYHTDEIFEVKRALKLGAGQLDLERGFKGGLYFILFIEYGLYFLYLKLAGAIHTSQDFLVHLFEKPTGFWLIGRGTVALIGALNVYVVYRLGAHVRGRTTGLVAAAFLMFATDHVESSHFITVDVLMVTLLCLTFYKILDVARSGTTRSYLLAGLLASLATMTKLPAIMCVLSLVFVHFHRVLRNGGSVRDALTDRRLWMAAGVFLVVMAILNPGFFPSLLEMVTGLPEMRPPGELEPPAEDPYPARTGNVWLFYVIAMAQSLGAPVLILGLAGLVRGFWRRSPWDLAAIVFLVVTYIFVCLPSEQHQIYSRYSLPLQVLLVVLAAEFLIDLLQRHSETVLARRALVPIVLFLLAFPITTSVRTAMMLRKPDTRTLAKEWVEANIPEGSRIVIMGRGYEAATTTVPLTNTAANMERIIQMWRDSNRKWATDEEFAEKKDRFHQAAVTATRGKKTYDLMLVSAETDPWRRLDHYLEQGAQYLVIQPEWLQQFLGGINHERFPVVGDFYRDILESRDLELQKRFEPDGNPGPDVEIYKVTRPRPAPQALLPDGAGRPLL